MLVLARSLELVQETARRVANVMLVVSVLALVLIVAIGTAVVRVGLRPLGDVEAAARRVSDGDFAARAPHEDEGGEVGSLARSFNPVAAQVGQSFAARERSEERLRLFLANANHELRTPLTTIRAYSELTDADALPADESTRQAVERIESEAVRMGVLVEDLLLLALLDQQRALRQDDIDLEAADHLHAPGRSSGGESARSGEPCARGGWLAVGLARFPAVNRRSSMPSGQGKGPL